MSIGTQMSASFPSLTIPKGHSAKKWNEAWAVPVWRPSDAKPILRKKIVGMPDALWRAPTEQVTNRKKLMVSNPQVADCLKSQAPVLGEILESPVEIELDHAVDYGRDARVCLPTGEHYISRELKIDEQEQDRFSCMSPMEEDQAQGRHKYGRGITLEYREAAIAHAKKEGISVKQGTRSCVEGGNCRIVVGNDGQTKAYLGYNSILLTILSLENQGYFQEREAGQFLKEHMLAHPNPELDSFRVGYNLFSHQNRPCKTSPNGSYNPCQKIYGPVPPRLMRQKNYIQAAQLFEAKRELAKRVIAKDLGIPYENIAYLSQGRFHIDLECFATPDHVVFLHDENTALETLNAIHPFIEGEELETVHQYIENAIERSKISESRSKTNRVALEKMGCKVVLVGGDFYAEKVRVNFMNGVLLENGKSPLFLTNGTVNSALNCFLKAHFLSKIQKASPGLKVIFAADQTPHLQNELVRYIAGLHCMTWVNSPNPSLRKDEDDEKNSIF